MKRFLLFAWLLLAAAAASAQTRDLLRKSIGGDVDLPEADGADFGLPSWTQYEKIDSVIFESDSVALVVMASYRRHERKEKGTFRYRHRYTLFRDPRINNRQPVDTMLRVLQGRYGMEAAQDVKFVGLKKEPPVTRKQKSAQAPVPQPQEQVESAKDAPAAHVTPAREPQGQLPLFAGGTALFALGLCAGIVSLYRRSGTPS